ncbi:hypothetical protein FNV43_RR18691 [Rhamnella rubrinervis]|uniref:Uncharacterized protein n=1 Tax=Rhamnella rubrinervis TaxID=2594499 RepID=A0A8K0EBD3_9ROSA|nr:hypothetical protein FNV43_RR18691 [Rhamnella rubrinervis]
MAIGTFRRVSVDFSDSLGNEKVAILMDDRMREFGRFGLGAIDRDIYLHLYDGCFQIWDSKVSHLFLTCPPCHLGLSWGCPGSIGYFDSVVAMFEKVWSFIKHSGLQSLDDGIVSALCYLTMHNSIGDLTILGNLGFGLCARAPRFIRWFGLPRGWLKVNKRSGCDVRVSHILREIVADLFRILAFAEAWWWFLDSCTNAL